MLVLLRRWRRSRWAKRPFPSEWHTHLEKHVPFYRALEGALSARFLHFVKCFVWEKHFIGAGGMEIDDEVRVVIAATAVRLVLHLDLSRLDRLTEIVVYPTAFRRPGSNQVILGEAHAWGTVVLSWEDVLHGLRNPHDGHDTATHEFAHVLDRADGAFDGTPELRAREDYRAWALIMSRHFLRMRGRKRRRRKVLRRYAATNEAEFFAVATEAYFEKPWQMRKRLPDVYDELRRFYGWDPCALGSPADPHGHPREIARRTEG